MMSIKYYSPSILVCYPASFGGCVRIPLQKMTNIPMTTCMVWGSESRYDGWNQNETADQKERPRRKTKRTHSFVDRLHWVRFRSTPYTSCLALPSLFPSDFQLSNSSVSSAGMAASCAGLGLPGFFFLIMCLSVDRRTQPQPLDLISFIL